MTNRYHSHGLQEDDTQDQIGSKSPSPTGVATPQPDPSDKRLPSIMHNFLQVGVPFGDQPNPSKPRSFPSETPTSACYVQSNATRARDHRSSGHSSSPSGSYVMTGCGSASEMKSSLTAQDHHFVTPESLPPTNLPTPPYCSASSLLQKESDEAGLGSSGSDKSVGSIFNALKNYLSPGNSSPEPPARRHTSHPVSSVSDDPVLASHFSNPTLSCTADALCLPEAPLFDHEKPLVSTSSENLAKLTGNVSDLSHLKNTPPLTPRAMSNEGSQTDKKPGTSTPPTSEPTQSDDIAKSTDEIAGRLNEAFPTPSDSPQPTGPPVGSLKGQLYVKISQARGLRPGFDPYVVCVFEWNEVISKSAQDEEEASLERQQKEQEKSDVEAGRPMAIPMKSRQSSNNSALDGPDHRSRAPVTDPHWNHEATL